ncbi:hypothetical protein GCM10020258_30250 [Sphingomonas yabuuchiae]
MPGFVLQVRPRDDGDATIRVGFTVTKKIGNAVVRNRMKRRLRALARDLLPEKGIAGADHVLIGRQGGIERDYQALTAELAKALTRAASPDTGGHDKPREPRVHHGRGKGRSPVAARTASPHRRPKSPRDPVRAGLDPDRAGLATRPFADPAAHLSLSTLLFGLCNTGHWPLWRGQRGWLALKRIARCHPWGGHGPDPVP